MASAMMTTTTMAAAGMMRTAGNDRSLAVAAAAAEKTPASLSLPGAPPSKAPVGTPLRALRERLDGATADGLPWSGFLPTCLKEHLQCQQAALQRAAEREGLEAAAAALGGGGIEGKVWELSRDAVGCRAVQRALDDPTGGDAAREALASELRGHVWEALQCPHANHVLQKCILTSRPEAVQFIVDELGHGRVLQAAHHKYGCRIVQKVVENLPPSQTCALVESLLQEVRNLSRHAYGNYVIQNLLQHGTPEQRDRILKAIASEVRGLATDPYGVAVVGAVLQHGSKDEQRDLAAILVEEDEELLLSMACLRLGHGTVQLVLEALPSEARQKAMQQLKSRADVLRSSRFGRQVLESLRPEVQCPGLLPSPPPLSLPNRRASGRATSSSVARPF